MKQCRECKSWSDCPGFSYPVKEINTRGEEITVEIPWLSYGDIEAFCRPQIIWIISNLTQLELGIWPAHPVPSAYVDAGGLQSINDEAEFENALIIYALVSRRLARTGQDGEDLQLEIANGYSVYTYGATMALNFMCGQKERKMAYSEWKASRAYRQKKGQIKTTVTFMFNVHDTTIGSGFRA